jgi:hypothetical protein
MSKHSREISRSQKLVGREYSYCRTNKGGRRHVRKSQPDNNGHLLIILICDCVDENVIDMVEQPGTIRA